MLAWLQNILEPSCIKNIVIGWLKLASTASRIDGSAAFLINLADFDKICTGYHSLCVHFDIYV